MCRVFCRKRRERNREEQRAEKKERGLCAVWFRGQPLRAHQSRDEMRRVRKKSSGEGHEGGQPVGGLPCTPVVDLRGENVRKNRVG